MATGPQNAVMGEDPNYDLPKTEVPEQDLKAERDAAKFSQSREFGALKEHLEQRMAYYQTFLPSGKSILESDANYADLGAKWMVANVIVTEFNAIIGAYEQAAEAVRRADGTGTAAE